MSRKYVQVVCVGLVLGGAVLLFGCGDQAGTATHLTQVEVSTTALEVSTTTIIAAPTPLAEDGWLLGIPLPTTVSQVIAKLGEPDYIELPDLQNDPSPWGQWFRWRVGDNDFMFSVLNDDYSDEIPGYDANVSVVALQRQTDVVSPELMDGLMLGLTMRSEVEAGFGSAAQPSGLADLWPLDETDTYATSLVREQNGVFTFYLFDPDGVLVGIVQATFDLTLAD